MTIEPPIESSRAPMLAEITRRWPALVYITLGCFISYCYLMSEGTSWLSDIEVNGHFANELNIIVLSIMAGLLIISAIIPRWAQKLLEIKNFLVLAGIAGALSSFCILMAGPFFLDSAALFNLGAILLGIVGCAFTLAYGSLFSQVKPGKALIYIALSFLLFTISYFVIAGSSSLKLIEGAPSISGALAIIVLPIIVGIFTNHGVVTAKSKSTLDANLTNDNLAAAEPESSESYNNKSLFKLIAASFIFGISASLLKSNFFEISHISSIRGLDAIDMMLLALFCFFIILAAVRNKGKLSFGKVYLLAMLAIAIVCAVVPIIAGENIYLAAFASFLYNTYDLLVWCLVAFIVYLNKPLYVVITGAVRGFLMLGTLSGIIINYATQPLHVSTAGFSSLIINGVIAILILVCALFVFTEKDLNSLFSLSSIKDEYDSTLQLRCASCIVMAGVESSAHNTTNNLIAAEAPKPFRQVIDRLATNYCLSNREKEVFVELAHGRNTVHVARRLFISENTVRSHTRSIYSKLNVTSHDALVDIVDEEYRVSKAT